MEAEQKSFLARASRVQIRKAVTSDFIGSFSSSLFNFAISLYILKLTGSAMNFGNCRHCWHVHWYSRYWPFRMDHGRKTAIQKEKVEG